MSIRVKALLLGSDFIGCQVKFHKMQMHHDLLLKKHIQLCLALLEIPHCVTYVYVMTLTANNYITQLTLLNTTMRSKTFYEIEFKLLD